MKFLLKAVIPPHIKLQCARAFVDDLISGPLMNLWQKFEPVILEERRRKNVLTIWEWFGYLYNRVKEVVEKEHGSEHVVDMERLIRRPESD